MPRVPRLPSAPRPRPPSLSAQEEYLLTLIDGAMHERELALMAGMSPDHVGALLDQLALLGAIELGANREDGPVRPTPPPTRSNAPGAPPPRPSQPVGAVSNADAVVELEPERRARVDELWARLDELTYYDILGVHAGADKKQVKSAYYALAPEFHPDKYFRRQLGDYRHRIEGIFARITLAHDVLTVPARRTEYDAYLEQTRVNRSMSQLLDQTPEDVEAILAAVERAAADAAAKAAQAAQHAATQQEAARPRITAPPTAASEAELLRQRREALARKLVGGGAPKPVPSQPRMAVPNLDAVARAREAALRNEEAVRKYQETAAAEARRAQVNKYIDSGKASLEASDWAGAANSYRIAASVAPDDPDIQATCAAALQKVAAALADGYWKQGLYEESQERWGEAALSFSKVCTGRPLDAAAHDRVAFATLKSSTNFRRAVEFARKAIELAPKKPEYRVTLARAYGAAGLEKSAAAELDRALELSPKDARVNAMVAAARTAIAVAAAASAPGQAGPAPPAATPAPSDEAPRSKKPSGIHAFVTAVRSALAPKEGK